MQTQALRQFLRNLEPALAAVGVPAPQLHGLKAVEHALERFPHYGVDRLAELLHRADELSRNGQLPSTAEPPALGALKKAVDAVEKEAGELRQGRDASVLDAARNDFRSAVEALAKQFGEKVSFKADAGWLAGLKEDAAISGLAARIEALIPRVTSPTAYDEPDTKAEIDALAGEKKLIGRTVERLGGPAGGTPRSLVLAILTQRSGIPYVEPEKTAKKSAGAKPKKPKPGPAEVAEKIAVLKTLADKAEDPATVNREEVIGAVEALDAEGFSLAQIKEIALAVANEKAKNKDLAFAALRETLLGARRIRDAQEQ